MVTVQLSRFVTLNRHQLAGQAANLDFWLAQVRHCQQVIDGYNERFARLKAAQNGYAARHGTTEFLVYDPCRTAGPAASPRRVPDGEMRYARRALSDAAYRFLVRCCNEGFIEEAALRSACQGLGIGVEVSDLTHGRPACPGK